mmetsp:Transcript_25767/g.34185  ORF Transcript_25767/g.34185 Transcript_25767/m.34185 type:complete len:384 (+) Transcript_25767:561-1712(+)
MGLFSLNIGLNENGADLSHVRETLNLVIGDRSHESSLSGIVTTEKTVTLTTLELHLGVVQKNLGSVGKCELTVAEFLSIIFVVILLWNDKHLLSLNTDGLNNLICLGRVNEVLETDGYILSPLHILHKSKVHHTCSNSRGVGNYNINSRGGLNTKTLLEFITKLGSVSTHRESLVGKSLKTFELTNCPLSHLASLRISDRFSVGLKSGKEKGEEGSCVERVVNKFGHVVDDNSRLTLGSNSLLAKSTKKKWHNHCKSRTFDRLDKCYSSHCVHDFRNLLRFGNSSKNLIGHMLNILVSDNIASRLHCCGRSSLDLLFGVPHTGGDLRNNLRKGISKLSGCCFVECCQTFEGKNTGLPFLFDGKLGKNLRKQTLHCKRSNVLAY